MNDNCYNLLQNGHCRLMEMDNAAFFIQIKEAFEHAYPNHNVPYNGECPFRYYGEMVVCPYPNRD